MTRPEDSFLRAQKGCSTGRHQSWASYWYILCLILPGSLRTRSLYPRFVDGEAISDSEVACPISQSQEVEFGLESRSIMKSWLPFP